MIVCDDGSVAAVLILFLLSTVVVSQPAVNAPLVPQFTYVIGNGSSAVVTTVVVGRYAFTADVTAVWGLMVDLPPNQQTPFHDRLPGVSQMWSWCGDPDDVRSCRLHVIAGPTVAMYKMNESVVWRSAVFTARNASFNIISDSRSPSYMFPAVVLPPTTGVANFFFVLGTRNTSTVPSGTEVGSTVYAFSVLDLSIVWSTPLNSDTSNFVTKNCSDFVWILTQNQTLGFSNTVVRKLDPLTGILTAFSCDTGLSNSVQNIGVANGQFIVVGYGGYLTFGFYNGTIIAQDFSIPTSCGTMPFSPFLLNTTWYVVCGTYLEMWDAATGIRRPPFIATNSIRCGDVHKVTNEFVFAGSDVIYVATSSSVDVLVSLPNSIGTGSSTGTCTGAGFAVSSVSDAIYFSFVGYYSGSVIGIHYRSGVATMQAVTDVSPLGPAVADNSDRRLLVSSTLDYILQGFEMLPLTGPSYVSDFSNFRGSPTSFSIVFNASNQSVYFISVYNLYIVDRFGNSESVASFNNVTLVNVEPVMIGQYLVFCDSFAEIAYVYNSHDKKLSAVPLSADIDSATPLLVYNTTVIIFHLSNVTAATAIDVATTSPLEMQTIATDSYITVNSAVLLSNVLVVITGTSSLSGYDTNIVSHKALLFSLPLSTPAYYIYLILSDLAVCNNVAYFVAYAVVPTSYVLCSVTSSGVVKRVAPMMSSLDITAKFLFIKSGGVFGRPLLYVVGSNDVAAYLLASMTLTFHYHSSKSILSSNSQSTVLDSGAVCFYTASAFTVLGGFTGDVAWSYNTTSASVVYRAKTDGTYIYFSDGGTYVIGADVYTGAVASLSTYGHSTVQGYAIVAAQHRPTFLIGAISDNIVFALQLNATKPSGGSTLFPGSFVDTASISRSSDMGSATVTQEASRSHDVTPSIASSVSQGSVRPSLSLSMLPPILTVEPTTVQYVTSVTASVGAALTTTVAAPSSGFAVQRLSKLSTFGDCNNIDYSQAVYLAMTDDVPMFLDAPLQMQFGEAAGAAHRGTVIGNLIAIVVVCLLSVGVTAIHWRIQRHKSTEMESSFTHSAAALRLPGVLVVIAALLLDALVASSTLLVTHGQASDIAIGILGLAVVGCLYCALCFVLDPRSRCFRAEAVPVPLPMELSGVGSAWSEYGRCAGRVQRYWTIATAASHDWESLDSTDFVEHYGHLFEGCTRQRHWWLLVEVGLTIIVAVLRGIVSESDFGCKGRAWGAFALCVVAFGGCVALRPLCSIAEWALSCSLLASQWFVLACGLAGVDSVAGVIGLAASVAAVSFTAIPIVVCMGEASKLKRRLRHRLTTLRRRRKSSNIDKCCDVVQGTFGDDKRRELRNDVTLRALVNLICEASRRGVKQ